MNRSFCVLAGLFLVSVALAVPAPDPFVKLWGHPIDPDKDCKIRREGSALSIDMPGTDHDYDPLRKQFNAPRILHEVEGDFDLQARIRIDCCRSAQSTVEDQPPCVSAGFLMLFPDTCKYRRAYMRLDYCKLQKKVKIDYAGKPLLPDPKMEQEPREIGEDGFVLWRDWSFAVEASKDRREVMINRDRLEQDRPWLFDRGWRDWPIPKNADCVHVRMEQRGYWIRFFLSPDGEKWTESMGTGPSLLAKGKVGLAAYTTSSEPSKVRIDQIKFTQGNKKRK
jgi:hypothetical protein